MAKKVFDLEKAVNDILTEYGDSITENVQEAAKKVTKAGVKAVKQNAGSSFKGTGKYASGWTSKFETGRLSAQGVIYNKKLPGLPHLLEHGHAKRGGGRVEGKAHIKPVEEQIVKQFEEAITNDISRN